MSSSRSTKPITAAMPLVSATTCSSAFRLSRMKLGLSSRSSGGYPVRASSGNATRSAPRSRARPIQSAIFSEFPPRSPTVKSAWARATLRGRATCVSTGSFCLLRRPLSFRRARDDPARPRGEGGRGSHGGRPAEGPIAAFGRPSGGSRRPDPDPGREAHGRGPSRDLARHLRRGVAVRCIRCQAPANVEVRRYRSAFCAGCYPGWFRNQVERAITQDRMFTREDRPLVAISGGKDSLALWHALTRLGYQADGMYIRLGIGDYSRRSQAKSEAFAARHGLKLHQVDLDADEGFTVPHLRDARGGKPCAACGTVKRYHFNKVAADLGYNV